MPAKFITYDLDSTKFSSPGIFTQMSFEGYYQLICKQNHYYERDAHDTKECHHRYSKAKWFHVVDQTNGDEGEVYMDVYTIGFPGKAIWMHLEDEEEFKFYYDWDKI